MREGEGCEERRGGQVLVEVLLILPVFLFLVFMIMEIGNLSFRTILLQHAAYEAARLGSLTSSGPPRPRRSGCNQIRPDMGGVQRVVQTMLPGAYVLSGDVQLSQTLGDPQEGCRNFDLVVTVHQNVPLIFPMTGLVLANVRGGRYRALSATVRMPVERPLFR